LTAPVFIGDEVSAAAYRLAGASVRVTGKRNVARVFGKAVAESGLLIITADLAAALPENTLRDAVRKADPLVMVVPDAGNRTEPDDLDRRVDRVLGIEQ